MELMLSLTDVAHLAQVQRPVVSMWRARAARTVAPFPPVKAKRGAQEFFDASEVSNWLASTGRGNNPSAAEDAAAFAVVGRDHLGGVTALLTLHAAAGTALGELDADELLDLADELDPDDTHLMREIESLGDAALQLASYVDRLVDAAYGALPALESLLAERQRAGLEQRSRTRLSPAALELVAEAALEVSAGARDDGATTPTFLEATPGGSDLLLAVADMLGESAPARLGFTGHHQDKAEAGTDRDEMIRLALRRLRMHLLHRENLESAVGDGRRSAGMDASMTMLVAQYPSPGEPDLDQQEILTSIDDLVLEMGPDDAGLVIAPAAHLVDGLTGEADSIRSQILRSGRVRAAIRLPERLLPANPRQAMALWVLGSPHLDVSIADRWTMVADLSAQALDEAARQDIVSDIAASLGNRHDVRAHAFRFARLVPTRKLLASRGALTADARLPTAVPPRPPALAAGARPRGRSRSTPSQQSGVDLIVRAERALSAVESFPPLPAQLCIRIDLPESSIQHTAGDARRSPTSAPGAAGRGNTAPGQSTLGALLQDKSLRYLPGARLDRDHLGTEGVRVWTADGLDHGYDRSLVSTVRDRPGHTDHFITPLLLAAHYPQAQLTEPGDIVFRTGARPAAVVDGVGAAVVQYPARVLRLRTKTARPEAAHPEANRSGAAGLVPAVIAADINAAPGGPWRRWPVRRFTPEATPGLVAALGRLADTRAALAERLGRLDDLERLLIEGAAAGVLGATTQEPTMEGRP